MQVLASAFSGRKSHRQQENLMTIIDNYLQLLQIVAMAHALTKHYDEVIYRLLRLGIFANRSEAVRAGLKELEEKYLGSDYSRPRSEEHTSELQSHSFISYAV